MLADYMLFDLWCTSSIRTVAAAPGAGCGGGCTYLVCETMDHWQCIMMLEQLRANDSERGSTPLPRSASKSDEQRTEKRCMSATSYETRSEVRSHSEVQCYRPVH